MNNATVPLPPPPLPEVAPPPRASPKEWLGLAVLALPCLVYSMDLTVLNLALPQIAADLNPSATQLLWMVDIYGFMVAGFLIIMGNLGDQIGRRKLLLIGALAFALASGWAASTTSTFQLIAARGLLGIAGATLAPSTLSLIRTMFTNPQQRAVAIGVWMTSFSVGGALGPLVGAVVLVHFGWGAVFLVAVPVMALLLLLGPLVLPEYKNPTPTQLDLLSGVWSLGAILAFVFSIKQLAEGDPGWLFGLSLLTTGALAWLFWRRLLTAPTPLLDRHLFRQPVLTTYVLLYALGAFVLYGMLVFVFQYLQLIEGLAPLQAGLWAAPSYVGLLLGSTVAAGLVRRLGSGPSSIGALGVAALGFGLLTQVGGASGFACLITGTFLYNLGLAVVFTQATDIVVGAAPPERAGAAAAISETAAELGGALGIALLGSVGAWVYRSQTLAISALPLPTEVVQAARQTLAGAALAAQGQAPAVHDALLGTAQHAFVAGMELVAGLSGVLMLALMALAWAQARRVQPVSGLGAWVKDQ
ncbi:MFS transporter [Hymenobacter artigasi]|uniref:DHA2 family multidrug resistance protein-like MFS transporter n=1 Tax=Hymenobacter artigasi TaxID=2719616 RepID=A0ABX1HQI3_9BACT|nr:MFS transporter [Hymenobacter artigasi]NKI91341.1 DHA2 family multidrug resistance protein-like MFS transporter [Hymenobacter artigasi]